MSVAPPSAPRRRVRWWAWLRVITYLAGHGTWRAVREPAWGARAVVRALGVARAGGLPGLRAALVDDYLPRHYRLATKLRVRQPSSAVFRRFGELLAPPAPAVGSVVLPTGRLERPPTILVIRRRALGDVLMATPIVRRLHESRGGFCHIDVATRHGDVFRNNPYVRRTLAMEDLGGLTTPVDLVLDLDGVYERNPACHPTHAYAFHALGHADGDLGVELYPSAADRALAEDAVRGIGRPFAVIHRPGRRSPQRHLPDALWQHVIDGLLSRTDLDLVVVGTRGDDGGDARPPSRVHDVRGRFTVQVLHEVMAASALFVGGDSGPAHVAGATGVPMAVFYTNAHHDWRRPLRASGHFVPIVPEIDCYGCQGLSPLPGAHQVCARGDVACVSRFDPDRALAAVLEAAAALSGTPASGCDPTTGRRS